MKEDASGRWKVLSQSPERLNGKPALKCVCSCGAVKLVDKYRLEKGQTKSCGCLKREDAAKRATKHGLTSTPLDLKLYRVWQEINRKPRTTSAKKFVKPEWVGRPDEFISYAKTLQGCSENKTVSYKIESLGYTEGNIVWCDNPEVFRAKITNEGKVLKNTQGVEFKIIEYKSSSEVIVEFGSGFRKTAALREVLAGKVSDHFHKSMYDVGYLGDGKYTSKGIHIKCYNSWRDMLKRCYSPEFKKERISKFGSNSYENCEVCDEWKNYQNFASWYFENKTDFNGRLEVDKDIIYKGNKLYCPEKSSLVPARINTLFIKRNSSRGDYPIGVSFHKATNKYQSCAVNSIHSGIYNTPEEAFSAYKAAKESYIKQVAKEYQPFLSKECYSAMMSYTVSIND